VQTMGVQVIWRMLPLGHHLRELASQRAKKGPAPLYEMHAARPFGPGAAAVAAVLVIGDAVHRGGWFVATMSCRRATRRARR
jgi:hypothetical protein